MSRILTSRLPERSFAKEDHSVEALTLDRPDEPLRVGVEIWRPMRQSYNGDSGALQQALECRGVLGVPIEDEEFLLDEEAVDRWSETLATFSKFGGWESVKMRGESCEASSIVIHVLA